MFAHILDYYCFWSDLATCSKILLLYKQKYPID